MTIVPQKSDDTVHILEGRATLFKRPLTPHWHVRYKANGKWERTTTKCEELAEAKSKAVDIVTNAWFRERNDLPIVSKRFSAVAKLAIRRMEDAQKANQGKATYKTYIQALKGHLIPFLGNRNITSIDASVLDELDAHRIIEMEKVFTFVIVNIT